MTGILEWFIGLVLNWLLQKALGAAATAKAAADEARRRNEIDGANLKAYEEAKSRAERIEASLRLLNGDAG